MTAALAATVIEGDVDQARGRASALQRVDIEQRQSLWRLLLIAVLVLLALETVMANRRSTGIAPAG